MPTSRLRARDQGCRADRGLGRAVGGPTPSRDLNLPDASPAAVAAVEPLADLSGFYADESEPQACCEAPSAEAPVGTVMFPSCRILSGRPPV